jgi:hypothetical protein
MKDVLQRSPWDSENRSELEALADACCTGTEVRHILVVFSHEVPYLVYTHGHLCYRDRPFCRCPSLDEKITAIGEFYDAYDRLQEAYRLFNTLLPGDREIQLLYCRCGIGCV